MKKTVPILVVISFLLVIVILILCLVSTFRKEEPTEVTIMEVPTYEATSYEYAYMYNFLNEDAKTVYRQLYSGIHNNEKHIDLEPLLSDEEFEKVFGLLIAQEPQFYNVCGVMEYTVLIRNSKVNSINIEYLHESTEIIDKCITEVREEVVQECSEMTSREKVKYIHDYLINRVDYSETGEDIDNLTGVFYNKAATCSGYAKAFQYLCEQVGVQGVIVTGEANGNHMWNMVNINDEWLALDCTWDDPDCNDKGVIYYDYFLVDINRMEQSHKMDDYYKMILEV